MLRDLLAALVDPLFLAFVVGVGAGLLIARERRIYRAANCRGGDVDLTGRRP